MTRSETISVIPNAVDKRPHDVADSSKSSSTIRIGYLNDRDLNNPSSHGPYFMFQSMKRHPSCHVTDLNTNRTGLGQTQRYTRQLLGIQYHNAYSIYKWRKILSKIKSADYDVIFADFGSVLLDALEVDIPIVYSTDATFRQSFGYQRFKQFQKINEKTYEKLDQFEANAIQRAKLCLFPSQWASDSAIHDYGASQESIRIIELGPNILEDIDGPVNHTPLKDKHLNTIFIGRDWKKKGGDLAIECIQILRSRGVDITITVVGTCPNDVAQLSYVHALGNIDKQNRQAYQTFLDALSSAVLHIFPTTAEPFGLAIIEAAAHGCPTISTATGGLPTTIQDGQTGVLMAPNAAAEDWADQVMELVKRDRLTRMGIQARHDYETRLNWRTWCDRTVNAIQNMLEI